MLLSEEQIRHFDDWGFVVVPGVLGEAELGPVRGAITAAVDRKARVLLAEKAIADLHEQASFTRRMARIFEDAGTEDFAWNNEVFSRGIYDLLMSSAVLDAVESLLGPELTVNGDYWVRPKLPGGRRTTLPWHQDSGYYGPASLAVPILSLWIPLVDVDERNGCLKIIPGSNKWGLLPSESNGMHLAPTEDVEARGEPQSLPMRVGDILAFGQYTFHASGENLTEEVRWSIDLRYSPTGYDMEWLFERYPGFIARSRMNPNSVESWESWRKYRQSAKNVTDEPVNGGKTWKNGRME
jgi:ectoine hydroxylase-related dioxygenase (phytanoyl-CoA dioxygenase family)